MWKFYVCLCLVLHYVVSIIVLQSSYRGRESWLLAIIVLWMFCFYKWSVALSHDAANWSAVRDCGNS